MDRPTDNACLESKITTLTHEIVCLKRDLDTLQAPPTARAPRFLSSSLLPIGLVAALSLTVIGIVHASIPSSNGTITGCYQNNAHGALRIIDAATAACTKNETTLTWGQTGPQGLPGSGIANASEDTAGPTTFPSTSGQVGSTTITIPGAVGSPSHKVLLLGQLIVNKGSNVAVYAGLATDGTIAGPIQMLNVGPSGSTPLSLSHIVTLSPGTHTVSLQGLLAVDPLESYASFFPLSGDTVNSHSIQAIDLGASS